MCGNVINSDIYVFWCLHSFWLWWGKWFKKKIRDLGHFFDFSTLWSSCVTFSKKKKKMEILHIYKRESLGQTKARRNQFSNISQYWVKFSTELNINRNKIYKILKKILIKAQSSQTQNGLQNYVYNKAVIRPNRSSFVHRKNPCSHKIGHKPMFCWYNSNRRCIKIHRPNNILLW